MVYSCFSANKKNEHRVYTTGFSSSGRDCQPLELFLRLFPAHMRLIPLATMLVWLSDHTPASVNRSVMSHFSPLASMAAECPWRNP